MNKLLEDMVEAARLAFKSGLQTGNGGNFSVRIPSKELIIIKRSGSAYCDLTWQDLITIDFNGNVIEGSGKPSREYQTHAQIYRSRKDVSAIFHSHSPWSIACAERMDELPMVSYHLEMKIGKIPILRTDGHADQAMALDTEIFLKRFPGVNTFIQARHGIFSMTEDIRTAVFNADLVEESAKIAFLLHFNGA